MDGLKGILNKKKDSYRIVQQTQPVFAGPDPPAEPTCIAAPVATIRRFSLEEK